MTDSTLIADLIRAGVNADLVQRVALALIEHGKESGKPAVVVVREEPAPREPVDTRSPGARRTAAYRARKASHSVTQRHTASQSVTDGAYCDVSPAPSLPPSSPSPEPPSPPPTLTPPPLGERTGGREAAGSIPTTVQAQRLATLFHRRLTTPWSAGEIRALRKLGTIPEDELASVEAYYGRHWPPDRDRNILRHDLLTLLNNWPSEVDRAKRDPAPTTRRTGASSFTEGTRFQNPPPSHEPLP